MGLLQMDVTGGRHLHWCHVPHCCIVGNRPRSFPQCSNEVRGTNEKPLKSLGTDNNATMQRVAPTGSTTANNVPGTIFCGNRPAVEIADLAKRLDELNRLIVVVEDELAASDAAIHVVGGSWDKQARVSWHEIAPTRGRDDPILHGAHHNATMVHSERGTHASGLLRHR